MNVIDFSKNIISPDGVMYYDATPEPSIQVKLYPRDTPTETVEYRMGIDEAEMLIADLLIALEEAKKGLVE